jgi:type IV pilus assembly protein PilW
MKRAPARGTTLIELMVALVIGMILSLAVFGVMSTFEGKRRTIDAGADLDQSASVAMFQLDRWIRSAGAGLEQANSYAYGCLLYATKGSTQLLPPTASLPAPFASVGASTLRLAPVLILPNQTSPGDSNASTSGHTSDALLVMSSGNTSGQAPTLFTASAGSAQLNVPNTLAFSASDLILVADSQPASGGGIAPCMVTQADSGITSGAATSLALGGSWYAATVGTQSLSGYSDTGVAMDLGNATSRTPSFQLLGVGDHDTLYAYDLLDISDTQLQASAENVFEMHALYGVDTDADGVIDHWYSPSDTTAGYTVSALSAGTSTAAGLLKNIRAIRVGLILRAALPERDTIAAATSLTLFSDINSGALTYTRTLDTTEQHYRYRTIEATIPLRNNTF